MQIDLTTAAVDREIQKYREAPVADLVKALRVMTKSQTPLELRTLSAHMRAQALREKNPYSRTTLCRKAAALRHIAEEREIIK